MGVSFGECCFAIINMCEYLVEISLDIFEAFGLDYKPPEQHIKLTQDEERALAVIRQSGEAFAPAIAEKLEKLPYQIIPVLSSLEIKGLIIRLGGNRYAAL